MLTVNRKAYTRKDGTRVKATTYKIEDRGRRGRGPDTIKIRSEGALGGSGYTKKSATERHRLLRASVRESGYATTARRVSALRGLGKRTMTKTELMHLERDQRWLKREFGKSVKKKRSVRGRRKKR
jgi:hypothetical protein